MEQQTERVASRAWYGFWPLDAYALGPFRFTEEKTEEEAVEYMTEWAGEAPREVWAT